MKHSVWQKLDELAGFVLKMIFTGAVLWILLNVDNFVGAMRPHL